MTARVMPPRRTATELSEAYARLADAEQTLAALRAGEADAIVVSGPRGDQVYTLSGADRIYRDLIENLSEGTATLSADGTVLHCNGAMAAMLRLPAGEVTGTRFRDHVAPGGLAAVDPLLTLASGMRLRQEIDLATAGGGVVPVLLSAVAVAGERGEPLTCLIALDITEHTRAEAALAQLNAALERRVAERTAQLQAANGELEAFSYSVSHDLRAPLRVIDGYSRILLEDHGATLDAEGQRVIGVVRHEVRRMERLITDLLALSRVGRQAIEPTAVNMTELAGAALDEVLAEAPDRVVDVTLPALPPAYGAPAMIRQVWVNLLANAVKFTRPSARAAIEIGGSADGGIATYYVRDNGAGFDPRYVDRLFHPFQRLHAEDEFEGTGIGLALVHRIVSRHGGRVWAEGRVGEGATFFFSLPAHRVAHDTGKAGIP